MLRQLDSNLWVLDKPLRIRGIDVGGRMTVVKLPTGGLWLHSPVHVAPQEREALLRLGPIEHIVAPNNVHHLFVAEWLREHPTAQLYIAPGLSRKNPALAGGKLLNADDTSAQAPFGDTIKQCFVDGIPGLSETVFHTGNTLIVTDLVFNVRHVEGFLTRLFLKLDGGLGGVRATRMVRFLIKDRKQVKASLERILAWRFDRLIVTHGEVLNPGHAARTALADAYRFLLEGSP